MNDIDWEAVERSPEFQELVSRRRRFVVPATIFFLAWYLGFIALCGYAPDFMAESVYEGLTVGYVLALTQFVMVFALGIMYLRRSAKVYDPLAERVREIAQRADTRTDAGDYAGTGRFVREGETVARSTTSTTTEEVQR
jgi:uncharacterized membrane protein (DUF485 family)